MSDAFESFRQNFERILNHLMQNNLLLLVAMGEFYEKLANCCANNQTSPEGNKTECTTLQLGLRKIINEPKHI